jgi:ABC-type nitrate/sulfonate/bicarbonate transport system substrate-binding protein
MSTSTSRRLFLAGAGTAIASPFVLRSPLAQSKPIKLAWIRQFAPAALVQKQVELAQADGLNVELVGFNRGLDGMVALQKGDAIAADCLVGYSQFALALSQGIDLTVISGSSSGLNAIVMSPRVLPKGEIDEKNKAFTGAEPWKHLKGKTVGSARGSQMEFLLRSYMKTHGMDFEKDIKFVDLKTNADQVLALQQGNIDAAALVEPSATQARMAGYGVLLAFPYDAGAFARINSSLLVRSDAIRQYPEELQKLVSAHVKAIKFYQSDRAAWVNDTAKVTLFDVPTMTHLMNPQQLGLDAKYWANVEFDHRIPAEAIRLYAKNLFESGFIQKDVSEQVAAHLEYAFLAKATQMSRAELGG